MFKQVVFCITMSVLILFCFACNADIFIELNNPKKDWVAFFNNLRLLSGVDTFVESGTYLGHTAAKAALCFDAVHTVELMADFYQKSIEYLKDYSNVFLYLGDSIQVFAQILPHLKQEDKRVLFWLDGHFMSCMSFDNQQVNDSIVNYTPIVQEITVIKDNMFDKSIILIDDIRLFGTILNGKRISQAGNMHYPLIGDICTMLDLGNFACKVIGDIICAYDKSLSLAFSAVIEACTISRFFDGNNYSIEKVLEAEQIIAQAQGNEKEALQELYQDFSMPWRTWNNRSPHYNLWYGLMLQHDGDNKEACRQFEEVINLGYDHWRIFWYFAQSLYAIQDKEGAAIMLNKVITCNSDFVPAYDLLKDITNGGEKR